MVCRFRGRRGESLGDIEIWGPKLHTLRREDDSWLSRCRANPTRDMRSSPSAKFLPAQGRNRAGLCRLVSLLPCSSQYLKFTLRYPCDRMNVASKTNKQAQAKAGLFKLLFSFSHTLGLQKFPCLGSNRHSSSNPSHCGDARFLTHWATRELPILNYKNLKFLMPPKGHLYMQFVLECRPTLSCTGMFALICVTPQTAR